MLRIRHLIAWIAAAMCVASLLVVALAEDNPAPADTSHAAAPPAKPAAAAKPAGDPALGKKVFAAKKCATCHKNDGSGGIRLSGNPTPNWRDAKRMADPKYNDDYLRECLTNGRPKSGMPAWGKTNQVKAGEIENLIAYIRTFSAPAPPKNK